MFFCFSTSSIKLRKGKWRGGTNNTQEGAGTLLGLGNNLKTGIYCLHHGHLFAKMYNLCF